MLTPKTNSRTCWPKVVLHVMNGTIFFDCWASWICRCFPAAIFFQTERRVSCPRELRKARLKKVRQWRNRDRWSWCQGTSWAQRKPLRKIRVLQGSLLSQEFDQSFVTSSTRKLVRNNNQDPTAHWWQDDTLSSSTRKLVRSGESASSASTRKLVRGEDNQIERTRLEFHNMQISDHRYREQVFKNLRQKLNLAEDAPVLDLKTKVLIWGLFMSTTMEAAVHFGPSYKEKLEVHSNTNFEELKNLFDFTQRLILEHQAEILKVPPIDWTAPSLTRSTLTHDQEINWMKTKVHVYWDSVICLWKMQEHSEANQRWKDQLEEFRHSNSYREFFGIDGEPVEFEWNMFPGLT